MIEPGMLSVEPWAVSEPTLRLDVLAQTESIFALSNGHIGLRGNLDEGEPHGALGTYLSGFFETHPLPYAEGGYGYPEQGQSLINVTDGKLMRLLVDDEPFDVRYGHVHSHVRTLDLRAGVLNREVLWSSITGQTVRIRSARLVSLVQRAVAAVQYDVEVLDAPANIVVQSPLVANEPAPQDERADPRAAAALRSPLVSGYHAHHDSQIELGHHARRSGLRLAAGLDHIIDGPTGTLIATDSEADMGRLTVSTELHPGQRLRLVKFLAYGWSSVRSMAALRDQVSAALLAAKRTGWEGLLAGQRAYLDDVWDRADIELDGDPQLQQAVRYALFQVVQAAARTEQRGIPAKGLTGQGYDGHTFWDMETYTLPVLTYTIPEAARNALRWRHSTLDLARARARELKLTGATFPWRTIRGEECSGYWPAGTAAFHINADVADAVRRYIAATDDAAFAEGPGLDVLVETARLWLSLGHHDAERRFRIDGVTGPDEYTALVDNNTYTNLMAARNLRVAADMAVQYPRRAAELGVETSEIAAWRNAAAAIVVPFDTELGVTAQSEGFTRYRRWDFDSTSPDDYPLLLRYPYYLLYSSQVIKQADLVLALYLCGDCFDAEQKRRDFEHYEAITVRDSTLSASIQGIVAAETGHLHMAYDYFRETALVDLHDLAGNTADGLHLAALAGTWLVAVAGFGGLRDHGETLAFAPCLPPDLTKLTVRLVYRGRRMKIDIGPSHARYELLGGDPLELLHEGEPLRLAADSPQIRSWTHGQAPRAVAPPPGREACRHGVGADARHSELAAAKRRQH